MPGKLIAVIDDDAAVRQMLDLLLRDAGFQVISSPSGTDAHQFILRTLPDLVLLDLWLEHRNAGVGIMGALRRDPLTRDIPVIVCSGRVDVLRTYGPLLEALGVGVLPKPFAVPALLDAVAAALALSEHSEPAQR